LIKSETAVSQPNASLAEEVYHRLRDDVLTGRLRGGAVVQERRLAAQLGVSRSPLRDAIGRMEGQGLIVRNAGGVLTIRLVSLQDYLNCIALRILTEPTAAALASTRIGPESLARLDSDLEQIEISSEPSPAFVSAFDDNLHETIALDSGNPFLAKTISDMRRYTTIFERQLIPRRGAPGHTDHRAILAALIGRDPAKAGSAMTIHLHRVRDRVLANF
jgi:DNA-binding GntR family transcriptional regulator